MGGKSKHGQSGSPVYQVWVQMRYRCTNPTAPNYVHYGARGIKVCQRWDSFESFSEDMGPRPGGQRRYSIDRIDNDGDYTPENCRWATRKEQDNNRSNSNRLEYLGVTKTVTQWAEAIGIPPTLIFKRISMGWPKAKILSPDRHFDTTGLALGVAAATAKKKAQTRCKYGHELTAENTYVHVASDGIIRRHCRSCRKLRGSSQM